MASRRARHTATILGDGRVLVVGGWDTVTTYATAEFYNPATNTWSPAPSLATARREHTATRLADGRVLVTGGTNTSITNPIQLNSGEIYDPRTNSWSPVPAMNFARRLHTATLLGNRKVLVVGTGDSFGEVYNPATNSWTPTASYILSGRIEHTATLLADGRVLVAGGQNGCCLTTASAELYNPATNSWSSEGSMSSTKRAHRNTDA